jgi:glycosyltransferase involved in cell wall biosynthesis
VTRPRISIVTPCLNRADFIAEAVQSVLAQAYGDVEHIVVDGGSTDGTLEVLARYPHLKVVSEPDSGLYDAINKGLGLATGDVIGHLNSDDLYPPDTFRAVVEAFDDSQVDMVSGGAEVLAADPDGAWRTVRAYPAARYGALRLKEITEGVPIINARFFRRAVYERVGRYDTAYPIAADREFLLRVHMARVREAVVDRTLYHYRAHPGSLTIHARNPRPLDPIREYLKIAARYGDDATVPPDVRRACRAWYGKEAMDGAIEALRMFRPGEAFRFAWLGWRNAPLFPASLAGSILWRVLRWPFKSTG